MLGGADEQDLFSLGTLRAHFGLEAPDATWDVVLDREQRILLPEEAPVQALERVIALGQVHDMLERDLAVVDMRLAARPTIRMNEAAVAQWRELQATNAGIAGR